MAVQQGMNQQTPAVQSMLRVLGGVARSARKRKSSKRAKSTSKKRSTRSKVASAAAKFVKGSAAAKRHMAKLRAMRKK